MCAGNSTGQSFYERDIEPFSLPWSIFWVPRNFKMLTEYFVLSPLASYDQYFESYRILKIWQNISYSVKFCRNGKKTGNFGGKMSSNPKFRVGTQNTRLIDRQHLACVFICRWIASDETTWRKAQSKLWEACIWWTDHCVHYSILWLKITSTHYFIDCFC